MPTVEKRHRRARPKRSAVKINDIPDDLAGCRLIAVRPMTQEETESEEWAYNPNISHVCLEFDNGTTVYAAQFLGGPTDSPTPAILTGRTGTGRPFFYYSVPKDHPGFSIQNVQTPADRVRLRAVRRLSDAMANKILVALNGKPVKAATAAAIVAGTIKKLTNKRGKN